MPRKGRRRVFSTSALVSTERCWDPGLGVRVMTQYVKRPSSRACKGGCFASRVARPTAPSRGWWMNETSVPVVVTARNLLLVEAG